MAEPLKMFVSYSHADEGYKNELLEHLATMQHLGLIAPWDDRQIVASEEWESAILGNLESADIILLLISHKFLTSGFCRDIEMTRAMERHDAGAAKVIPVFCRRCDWKGMPFGKVQGVPQDAKPIASYSDRDEGFCDAVTAIRELVEQQQAKIPAPRSAANTSLIATTRLPHGAAELIGREAELQWLDEAWADSATHIVSIVAWGGVGKTSLVAEWTAQFAARGWEGVNGYLDWSFYSQGSSDQSSASSDGFIAEALKQVGEHELANSPASVHDKAKRLAQRLAEGRWILVLDGLEPLQYPPSNAGLEGQFKDAGLYSLLRALAQQNWDGLCVLTSREAVVDLERWQGKTVDERVLEHLSDAAGAALLHHAGAMRAGAAAIRPDDAELLAASRELNGHALSLQLLGSYLGRAHGGDIRRRDRVEFGTADQRTRGRSAFGVIAAYEQWLMADECDGEGARMLAVLRLLGLFDRPAEAGCLAALREAPGIPCLSEPLIDLDEEDWNIALSDLATLGLVSCGGSTDSDAALDAHPLIREYFARQLQDGQSEAWRDGHRRLYEYLCESTEYRPDGLARLQPLYQAVSHGCLAGLEAEARHDVYCDRILRGTSYDGYYSFKKLGAIGANLSAAACFFDTPWRGFSANLSADDQAWLLNEAAVLLRALGRLREALEPMQYGQDMTVKQEVWENAAAVAINLSELALTLGDLPAALHHGEQSVSFADRSGDAFWRMAVRTTHANALQQAGHDTQSLALFREAEATQAMRQHDQPRLYSFWGFKYCELLLATAERAAWRASLEDDRLVVADGQPLKACEAVAERAEYAIAIAQSNHWLLDIALDHLTLGRTALCRALFEHGRHPPRAALAPAREQLDNAAGYLRQASTMDHLPRGLLTRAWLHWLEGNEAASHDDLNEAREIAERGPMPLFLADIALTEARLFRDLDQLAEAERLINQHGYHRRDGELADAKAVLLAED